MNGLQKASAYFDFHVGNLPPSDHVYCDDFANPYAIPPRSTYAFEETNNAGQVRNQTIITKKMDKPKS